MVSQNTIQKLRQFYIKNTNPGYINKLTVDPNSTFRKKLETANEKLITKNKKQCNFCLTMTEKIFPDVFKICSKCAVKYKQDDKYNVRKIYKKELSTDKMDCDWCKRIIRRGGFNFTVNPELCFKCYDRTLKFGKITKRKQRKFRFLGRRGRKK